jgi:hypothetical protein
MWIRVHGLILIPVVRRPFKDLCRQCNGSCQTGGILEDIECGIKMGDSQALKIALRKQLAFGWGIMK